MRTQSDYIQDALDSAYWAHLMGDELYAKQKLLKTILFLDRQEGYYEPTLAKKEAHETSTEDEYLIR